jgi:exo-beta-1,3-glucanase (GH17 family)
MILKRMLSHILLIMICVAFCMPEQLHKSARIASLMIDYQPRGFHELPVVSYPDEDSIIKDLSMLHRDGFRGLATYSAVQSLSHVPELARKLGFDGMIVMGIWDPDSKEEIRNASSQAAFVDGFCVGNEGLNVRYSAAQLSAAMNRIRNLTKKPVTTSERLPKYLDGPDKDWLVQNSDWLFPIAHPYWDTNKNVQASVQWIVARHDYLAATTGKRVVFREVGFPTGGDSCCTEDMQREVFKQLLFSGIKFFFFEAFDQPNKKGPEVEHHWGLYRADGSRKKIVDWLVDGDHTP